MIHFSKSSSLGVRRQDHYAQQFTWLSLQLLCEIELFDLMGELHVAYVDEILKRES